MGYLLTPDFVAYEQPETVNGGHELVFPIGKAAQSAFPTMFAKLFASAQAVSGPPGTVPHAQRGNAVIVPRLTESTIVGPEFAGWAGDWYVTLGYSFQYRGQPLRLYGALQNAFTKTGYSGVDPTAGLNGIDNNIYPRARTWTGGMSIRF